MSYKNWADSLKARRDKKPVDAPGLVEKTSQPDLPAAATVPEIAPTTKS